MTYGQLLVVLQQDVNRADKEQIFYPLWVNQALREIQTRHDFACARQSEIVTLDAGSRRAVLPSGFKRLTPERHAVHAGELGADGLLDGEVPCTNASREEATEYTWARFANTMGAVTRGVTWGPPYWIESDGTSWFLNIANAPTGPVYLRVSFIGFLPELRQPGQSNYLTVNYPSLVINWLKFVAFSGLNDPIAGSFGTLAETDLKVAINDDHRRRLGGRAIHMGGGGH